MTTRTSKKHNLSALFLGLVYACSGPTPTADVAAGMDTIQDVARTTEARILLERYVEGELSRDELRGELESVEDAEHLDALQGLPGVHIFSGIVSITADTLIEEDITAIFRPGTQVVLSQGVTLKVEGRLFALGTKEEPIQVRAEEASRYQTIMLTGGQSEFHFVEFTGGVDLVTLQGMGEALVTFENCAFDHWLEVALRFVGADGLRVADSEFGLNSSGEDHGECLNGKSSAAEIVSNTFGLMTHYSDAMDLEDCHGADVPHIVGNTFLGGQDDGIDLDDCDAFVASNLVMNFWPPDPANPYKGVNGGGITGHASNPLLINNVITGCFHGVGFKNGAKPTLIHNTITGGHIGVTFYRTNSGYPDPHGTLINNIIYGNEAFDSGANQDLVLNGKWWPSYDQSSGVQASVSLSHNLFGLDVGGDATIVADPLFVWKDELPHPSADSPAVGQGQAGPFEVPAFDSDLIQTTVLVDFAGEARGDIGTLGALEPAAGAP
jgi:hypothetical protein